MIEHDVEDTIIRVDDSLPGNEPWAISEDVINATGGGNDFCAVCARPLKQPYLWVILGARYSPKGDFFVHHECLTLLQSGHYRGRN